MSKVNKKIKVTLPNYEISRVLGSGSFGIITSLIYINCIKGYVFEANDQTNKRKVAWKRIQKVGKKLSREYEILFEIKDSENVVKILDFFYSKTDSDKLIQNIIFEYVEDNLESKIQRYLKQKKIFPELQIKSYAYQIFKGLEYVHSKDICHRDLKPYSLFLICILIYKSENLLISKEDVVKLCDFGSSKKLDKKGKNTPYIVSRYYRAPELILCISKYTNSIDIWAIGCILAEMITRDPLFQGKSEGDQLFKIFEVLGSPTEREYKLLGKDVPYDKKLFKDFVKYPKKELASKFGYIKDIKNLMDLLSRIFKYVPSERISATDAMKHPFFDDVRVQDEDKSTVKKPTF